MHSGGTLHIFNPETDFALGHGGRHFTPKASIISLRRKLALLPAIWAAERDSILLADDADNIESRQYHNLVLEKKLNIITAKELKTKHSYSFTKACPWGWNSAVRELLLKCGVPTLSMPSEEFIDTLRQKAHRRTTILFHFTCGTKKTMIPREWSNLKEIIQWCHANPDTYLKAPWSSSGRGVLHVSNPGDASVINWIRGMLERQNSLLAEPDWKQDLDFATEWRLKNGKATFLGYSLFDVDSHCQYAGNKVLRQPYISALLEAKGWTSRHLELQQQALEDTVGYFYSGPAGIDCLHSPLYGFNLCVEINLRMTMGIVNLFKTGELKFSDLYD